MNDLSKFCAPKVKYKDQMISVSDQVSLRVITFNPMMDKNNPAVVFVAGWISLIQGWKDVLREMTKDFTVYYIETREKITSRIHGKVRYDVGAIGSDIVALVSKLGLEDEKYILFGSSLGATVILDCVQYLSKRPLCLILVGPNAVFRMPKFGMIIVILFYPGLYFVLKPFIKWYLKHFRLNVRADYAQYEKYCRALDAADPWKLKNAALAFSRYQVWNLLKNIDRPALIVGASEDSLHTPENLKRMVEMMQNADYINLKTNKNTHTGQVVKALRKYLKGHGLH